MCKHKYVNFVSGLLRLVSSKDSENAQHDRVEFPVKTDLALWIIFFNIFKLRPGPPGLRLATPLPPIVVIFFHCCVSEVVVPLSAVCPIYIPGKLVLCVFIIVQSYDLCK